MPRVWELTAGWESLDTGSAEERACFAALGMRVNGVWLTEGYDAIANRLRHAPYLSAYALAEWLAWNWWRLRWEPRSMAEGWNFAHRMANIGGGYIWPDITIFSDGERAAFISKPTQERPQTPFRYINPAAAIISAGDFEFGVDCFVEQVLERLEASGVADSNLARIWADVREERASSELGLQRKIEALLGLDPDESDLHVIEQILADSRRLGLGAMEEMAADAGSGAESRPVCSAGELEEHASRSGFSASFSDMVRFKGPVVELSRVKTPAWQLGAEAARALRAQEGLGDDAIGDDVLCSLVGVVSGALQETRANPTLGISFALKQVGDSGRILLRSRHMTGRRFELARLLGDHLLSQSGEALVPATRAYTYRQKVQRAFAAELLSPFDGVLSLLDGDYSEENQLEIAGHFKVSELTIRTQLVNHGMLDRDELEPGDLSPIAGADKVLAA